MKGAKKVMNKWNESAERGELEGAKVTLELQLHDALRVSEYLESI